MERTKVVFKKVKEGYFQNDIIAFFISEKRYDWNNRQELIGCYQHIGQHGEATVDYMENDTVSASAEEYEALKNELERIGYDLIDMTGWEEVYYSYSGYYLYRKIENGKAKWLAEDDRTSEVFPITYQQALGYEPIRPTPIGNLARELGRILLP